MCPTLVLQPGLKSNGGMELLPIGEAARRLGLNASALRYYEERGLIRPAARRGGKRMYGPEEMRRLAFIQIGQRLGFGLDVAAAVFEEPGDTWRTAIQDQLRVLDDLMAQARLAQTFLEHALRCPAENPVRDCSYFRETLDRRVAGESLDDLAAEHDVTGDISGR
jgi:DNA-binding transcriptional MerR regulator